MYDFAINRLTQAKKLVASERVPEALDLFRSLLAIITDIDERRQILAQVDHCLLITGADDEANALWVYERTRIPPDKQTLETLIATALRDKRFSIAFSRLENSRGIVQAEKILLDQVACRIGQFEIDKAATLIASDPNMPQSFKDRFRIQTLLAEARFKELLDLIPTRRKGRSSELLRIRARALAGSGHYDTVESELQTHKEYYPDQNWITRALAENASAANWRSVAAARWAELLGSGDQTDEDLRDHVTALISNVEIDKAERVVVELTENHRPSTIAALKAKLLVVNGKYDLASEVLTQGIETAKGRANRRALAHLWSEKSALEMRRYSSTGETRWLDEHLASAQAAYDVDPEHYQSHIKLVDALIRSGKRDRVLQELPNLPQNNRPEMLRLKMWRQDGEGDTQAARKTWKLRRRIHYTPQIENGAKANLVRLDNNPLPATDDLALYTVIKNERKRLPWFFAYYRKLGVKHFVFVDNGSTDGSVDYLLAQRDVTIFRTEDSYVSAIAGMVWVNHLKNKISADGWALYVDVDEALVFDGSEDHTLDELIQTLELRGDEAMTGFMLDMYADKDNEDTPVTDTTDFVAKYPNFLNRHFENPAPVSPYRNIRGGARIVFGTGEELTKTPLVKVSSGVNFLRSSHNITPAKISDVTCVLLHFKLIDGLAAEAKSVLADVQRSADCQMRYRKYITDGDVHTLLAEFEDDCRVYNDSNDLIDLGLMTPIALSHAK